MTMYGGWVRSNAERYLASHEAAVNAGDGLAIMRCVNRVLRAGIPSPSWLTAAFGAALANVEAGAVHSWDDALGKPKGMKERREEGERGQEQARIYTRVCQELKRGGRSLTAILRDVADIFGCSFERVRAAYYAEKKAVERDTHKKRV
jgi:hypothetical protein